MFMPSILNCTPTTLILSEALAESVTIPLTVALLDGVETEMLGNMVSRKALKTTTATGKEVAVFPAASRATAVTVWAPFDTGAVSQDIEYGLAVSSLPILAPSILNWTPVTPVASEAVAEMVILPDAVVLAAGEAIETAGAVVSAQYDGLFIFTTTAPLMTLLLAASYALVV